MTFTPGAVRVFDRTGRPLGTLTHVSVTAPRTYRLNEMEDFAFRIPRADGDEVIITAADTPPYVGSSTAQNTTTTTTVITPHASVEANDIVLVVAGFDMAGANRTVSPPAGWQMVMVTTAGTNVGVGIWARRRAETDTTYTFTTSSIGPVVYACHAYRNVLKVGPMEVIAATAASASAAFPQVYAQQNKEWLLHIAVGDTAGTLTIPGATSISSQSITGVSMGVGHRIVSRGQTPAVNLSASPSMTAITASLIVQEMPSVEALLARDNLIYVANDIAMPGWGGVIEDVTYGDDGAEIKAAGTLSLLSGLDISLIEAEETEAAAIASRIVDAANAKKAAAGDLQIGFVQDGTEINHGVFSHEGDALAGINALARDSISEFYMRSSIDPETGYFKTEMHWNAEYDIDRTGVVIRDGVDGNLASGSQFTFSSADALTYARLIGAQTQASQYVNYSSVAAVINEVSPSATLYVANTDSPNNRRREAASFNVNWGLTEARQRELAAEVEAKYIDMYKRFLYAFHERWGQPFLDGFNWGGPKPSEIKNLTMTHMMTVAQLGLLGTSTVITSTDMSLDTEVRLTELRFKYNVPTEGAIGIALDHGTLNDRLIATSDGTIMRIDPRTIDNPTADLAYKEIVQVERTGEDLIDIATDASKASSLWALFSTSTGIILREFDIDSWAVLSEWTATGSWVTGLAVDALRGKAFILDNGGTGSTARILERELADGRLLRSPVTLTITHAAYPRAARGHALSFSGDVLYVVTTFVDEPNGSAKVTIFLADPEGSLSGTTYTTAAERSLGFAARGIYTDPWHSEIWFPLPDGTCDVYFASVAVAVTEGNRVADGAPGFDQIVRGTFVKIIYRDARVGFASSPKPYRPKHVCQFGRVVNGVWTSWGSKFDKVNCTMAAAAMALERHTEGKKTATPVQMRNVCGDYAGGAGLDDAARAWKLGWNETLNVEYKASHSRLVKLVKQGRGVIVQGDWDQIPAAYTCQKGFDGNHAVYINEIRSNGDFLVYDPICAVGRDAHDKAPKWIPQKYIFRYGQKFTGRAGTINLAYTKDTVGPATTYVSAKPPGYYGDWPGPEGIEKFMWAIAQQESGGNYCAVNGGSGAYGKYQIMPANWPGWGTKYVHHEGKMCCDTPYCKREQDHIARGKMSDLYQWLDTYNGTKLTAKKTWRRVAHWWLTGSNSYPESTWSSSSTHYTDNVMALYARAPSSPSTGPVANGRAFVVWTEGQWEDSIVESDVLGGPARIERSWVPRYESTSYGTYEGEWPKSGFRDDVVLAHPEQVIYGEEGRVNDWDPGTMGYGVNGYSFYKNVTGSAYRSKGWYLRPWDLPASYFWFEQPSWPTGEAYLARLIAKVNREQAAQALDVINRDQLWSQIELGGRYTTQCTEQGPKPGGITGVVRVVGFSPDETGGTMQLLTEGID